MMQKYSVLFVHLKQPKNPKNDERHICDAEEVSSKVVTFFSKHRYT